ncbi:MAG TPA: penicillin-binding transpeptidase domain-containing protein, partial [Solirubrobacteraceae bacterium]
MTERPRVLQELGDELDRAAGRVLTGKRRRFGTLGVGSAMAGLAVASALAVAAVAILLIGHRHPGQTGRRTAATSVPRGEIVDRDGNVLVGHRRGIDIQIVPADLPVPIRGHSLPALLTPPAADQQIYDRLAQVLRISTRARACEVTGRHAQLTPVACDVARAAYLLPDANVTIASDVRPAVGHALAGSLPGVTEATVYLNSYPHGDLAAQLLGYVGPITPAQLRESQFGGLPANAVVGQTGLEAFYDRYLRRRDKLETSLDLRLEQVGQASLARSISHNAPANAGGAFVAMDPQNGQVYAMGSLPAYNPTVFTKPISDREYERLFGSGTNSPQVDRATDGLYPTGSTFKPITALAALESGAWNLGETYDDTGEYCFTRGSCLHNSGKAAYGVVNMTDALRVSDGDFFYDLGAKLNVNPTTHRQGGALQQWARLFGIGQGTGIDLPYAASGNLPTPAWRAKLSAQELRYEQRHHSRCCTITRPGPWTVSDNVNLAVGQGELQVTPLQLAVAYAAIANGGAVVHPHIATKVVNAAGREVLEMIDPPPARHISIDAQDL